MRKKINWLKEEEQLRELGLSWMSPCNYGQFVEKYLENNTKDRVCHFMHDDERKTYEKRRLPNYWRYHNELISYKLNSDGFRAPEFESVDWKNSYVIFGCSHVFGLGNPNKETISEHISKELSTPVINLGSPGASVEVIYNNLLKQIDTYGKAKGYFFHWSYPIRRLNILNYWEDENDNLKPFWDRRDEVPTMANVKPNIEYVNNVIYRRHIIFHSVREILKDTKYSEIKNPRMMFENIYTMIKAKLKLPDNFIIPHVEGTWRRFPEEYKKWYMNEVCARDIKEYSEADGPKGSHFGNEINKELAGYLIRGLK